MIRPVRPAASVDGILLLHKPAGITSNRALQRVKRLFGARKAGHTGTLDPLATGMLVVCFGLATRACAHLISADKGYRAVIRLGEKRSTGDLEGELVHQCTPPPLGVDRVREILRRFTGEIRQIPPMYSALKHNGRALYKYAREGVHVERPARLVRITKLELIALTPGTITVRVRCSGGTYIRTLAEDIGNAVGCGACLEALEREFVEPFGSHDVVTLGSIEATQPQQRLQLLIPVDHAFRQLETVCLNVDQLRRFHIGASIVVDTEVLERARIYSCDGRFVGIGRIDNRELKALWKIPLPH